MEIELDDDIIQKLDSISLIENKSSEDIILDLLKEFVDEKENDKLKTILCNAFSLQMLIKDCTIEIKEISPKKVKEIIELGNYISYIGNEDIANVLGVEFNKGNITLDKNTRLIVVQLVGGRLPIGCIELPKGSEFKFYEVTLL